MSPQSCQSWEVEQKYVVADPASLQARLNQLGFRLICTEQHEDIYWRHPVRNFRQTDEAFRLRRVDDQLKVTYKGPREQAVVKIREEIELTLLAEDLQAWKRLLSQLGFTAIDPICKVRQLYQCLDRSQAASPSASDAVLVVALDNVDRLGSFAEIEMIITDRSQMEAARQSIARLAGQLELSQIQPLSYLAMILRESEG
jgi:adenylate cyclase class 2